MRRYPAVTLDVATDGRFVEIVLEGFAAGVRIAKSVPKGMVAIPIGPRQSFAVVGSAAYFRKYPKPKSPRRSEEPSLHSDALSQRVYEQIAQIFADVLGLALDRLELHAGASHLPDAGIAGGSVLAFSLNVITTRSAINGPVGPASLPPAHRLTTVVERSFELLPFGDGQQARATLRPHAVVQGIEFVPVWLFECVSDCPLIVPSPG